MHPSNRYSTRYPNRSLEVDPPCNPQSRIPTRSASNLTRLDSTRLDSKPPALHSPCSPPIPKPLSSSQEPIPYLQKIFPQHLLKHIHRTSPALTKCTS